jgi:hypothetical protein
MSGSAENERQARLEDRFYAAARRLGDEPDDLNPIRVDLKMFVAMAAHESLDLAVGMVRAVRALNRDVAKELAVVVYDAVEDAVGPARIRAMRAENDPEPTPRSSEVTAGQNVRENQDVIGKPALGRKKPNVLAREIAALERLEKSGDLVEFSDLYAVSSEGRYWAFKTAVDGKSD